MKPAKPPNQATVSARSLGVAGPELLDALQHFEVPAADLLGDRLQHLAAAERLRRRRAADDERLAPGRRRRLFEEHLGQAPLARLDGVAVEQRDRAHDLRRAEVEADRRTVLDRPLHVGQAVQPDRDDARRHQVAGRGQLLAADHVLVMDAGQVDGRPHAAMDFLDRLVVVLQRAHAHALAARQPLHLVADLQRCPR